MPDARVGHLGLQRDETTAVASQYYAKFPAALESSLVVLVDPMLATANSSIAAVEQLKKRGANNLRFLCLLAAPEGIAKGAELQLRARLARPFTKDEITELAFDGEAQTRSCSAVMVLRIVW